MLAVQKGDRSAFDVLVRRHINALHGYAFRLSRNPASADDLVQDTWLNVWQKAASYKPGKVQLTTWLHRIVHNKFVDEARKSRPTASENEFLAITDGHDLEREYATQQTWSEVDALLSQLPHNQRAAIVLTHVQGFSNQETAEIMNSSVRAVESLLARARRALRASQVAQEREATCN